MKGEWIMRVGSVLIILLAALVVLGFLLSDSMHLRSEIKDLQNEIQRLSLVAQQAEQEKQVALGALQQSEQEKQNNVSTLQNKTQELQACWRQIDQINQIFGELSDENTLLK